MPAAVQAQLLALQKAARASISTFVNDGNSANNNLLRTDAEEKDANVDTGSGEIVVDKGEVSSCAEKVVLTGSSPCEAEIAKRDFLGVLFEAAPYWKYEQFL